MIEKQKILQRISECENENRRLKKRLLRQNFIAITVLLLLATGMIWILYSNPHYEFDSIQTSELVVVDSTNTVRARLGGNLPDAVIDGEKITRGSNAAGLLIYDEEGIERGGYVTQDNGSNAMLTLDSKFGQNVLLVSGPGAKLSSALQLWTKTSKIVLRSDINGSRLTAIDSTGVIFQRPKVEHLNKETCELYKKLQRKYPEQQICRERFTEEACNECLL